MNDIENSFCLVMIVKDESKIIKRCLDNIKEILGDKFTYWVIADTGSQDNTKEIIRKELEGIPGVLLDSKWKSFGENRSEVFEMAYNNSDWCLLTDADFIISGELDMSNIKSDAVNVKIDGGTTSWYLPLITSNRMKFFYTGKAHEYLNCAEPYTIENYEGLTFKHHGDGSSSGSAQRNLDLLLDQEAYSARDMFYIGQSYGELNKRKEAVQWYRKYLEASNFEEEAFIARYRIGMLNRNVGELLEAWQYRQHRAEPIYEAVLLLREKGAFRAACALAEQVLDVGYPYGDILFIQKHVYDYDLLYQYSICLYYVDRLKAKRVYHELLGMKNLPHYVASATINNLKLYD